MPTTQVTAEKIRLKGRAEEDGIAFLICKDNILYPGRLAQLGDYGVVTKKPFYDNLGHANVDFIIKNEMFFGNIDHARIDYKIKTMNAKVMKVLLSIFITLMLFSIATVFVLKPLHSFVYVMLVIAGTVVLLNEVVTFTVFRIKKDWEIDSYLKFLAAMNSTRNAYYKLKRVPTLTEAMEYSSISPESKYLHTTYLMSAACYITLMHVIPNPGLMLLFTILLIISIICEKNRKIYFWQYAIYSKPEQIHYGVAISALEGAVQEMNKIIQK